MNSIEIKDKIKELKMEEQLSLKKLHKKKKNEIIISEKSLNGTNKVIEHFQSKLEDLAVFYQRTDMSKCDPNSNFVSEQDVTEYELLETYIDEQLEQHLLNLQLRDNENVQCSNDIDSNFLEYEFQQSLFLKHDAELANVNLEAELASIDAQINWLTGQQNHVTLCSDDESCDEMELSNEISKSIKSICINECLLEIFPDVKIRLKNELKAVKLMNEIVQQYHRQVNRQKCRLDALENELRLHESVEEVFDSLSIMVDNLESLKTQLENVQEIIETMEPSPVSKNDQLLLRLKSHFGDNFQDIRTALADVESTRHALPNELEIGKTVTEDIMNIANVSAQLMKEIYVDASKMTNFIRTIKTSNLNSQISLISKENRENFLLGHASVQKIKNRLKEAKNNYDLLEVAIKLDE